MPTLSSSFVQTLAGRLDELLAVGAALVHHRLDLGVLARVERLEREVLELPLDRVDTKTMRQRRVDLERLARLLQLLLLAQVLDRPHVVQAVGELDEDDVGVLRHRDDHLAVVLRLGLLAALELDPRQLRDALDERWRRRRRTRHGPPRSSPECPRRRHGRAPRQAWTRHFRARRGSWPRRSGGARSPRRSAAAVLRAPHRRSDTRARAGPGRPRGCTPRPPRAAPRTPRDAARRKPSEPYPP